MIYLLNSDARQIPLADQSVQCVVTSPPYWGLRDYGTAKWEGGSAECDHKVSSGGESMLEGASQRGRSDVAKGNCPRCGARRIDAQIGLESTPAAYVAHIVAVMRECWRVLKDDGVLWLNLGDSYISQGGDRHGATNTLTGQGKRRQAEPRGSRSTRGLMGGTSTIDQSAPGYLSAPGLKPKDLCGIPWRVAFALQDAGWYLRSDIIWHKPNPMPESVTDRPTKAHEYVFLLTKQARYYYDAEAIKEDGSGRNWLAAGGNLVGSGIHKANDGYRNNGNGREDEGERYGRNRRSVWTVATSPYSGAHFATFPPKLIEPMILAGTSARGECSHCGKAWVRVVERESLNPWSERKANGATNGSKERGYNENHGAGMSHDLGVSSNTLGWQPQCTCPPHEPIPQTVLDPFAGSGTTGAVAVKHGRRAVLLDLNTKYIDLQFERNSNIQIVMPM